MSDFVLLHGDCLEKLKELPDDSMDSMVTDPPAGIAFMGKSWDEDKGGRKQWIAWLSDVMSEALRVLKPGSHALVWAIPRTSHWTATALEDAGFEIRDVVTHLFGSGFPKSLDVSKAIDKAAGAEREVVGANSNHRSLKHVSTMCSAPHSGDGTITAPATDAAKQWQGWGTALKPASEHWILVRKPLGEKTVAANVLKHGTGGINIDASRICLAPNESVEKLNARSGGKRGFSSEYVAGQNDGVLPPGCDLSKGRFPANLVLSHNEDCESVCTPGCPVEMLDAQSGTLKQGGFQRGSIKRSNPDKVNINSHMSGILKTDGVLPHRIETDTYGASRFFYCAKPSKREKNAGCDLGQSKAVGNRPNSGDPTGKFPDHDQRERVGNHHPTVKSIKLMSYLIRMITPPEGVVLDPFMGSGTTGVSAIREGFRFIGIEQSEEYLEIATKRIEHESDAS